MKDLGEYISTNPWPGYLFRISNIQAVPDAIAGLVVNMDISYTLQDLCTASAKALECITLQEDCRMNKVASRGPLNQARMTDYLWALNSQFKYRQPNLVWYTVLSWFYKTFNKLWNHSMLIVVYEQHAQLEIPYLICCIPCVKWLHIILRRFGGGL